MSKSKQNLSYAALVGGVAIIAILGAIVIANRDHGTMVFQRAIAAGQHIDIGCIQMEGQGKLIEIRDRPSLGYLSRRLECARIDPLFGNLSFTYKCKVQFDGGENAACAINPFQNGHGFTLSFSNTWDGDVFASYVVPFDEQAPQQLIQLFDAVK